MEVGSELLLKPDGTFEYVLVYGAADYSARGKWRAAGQSVILDSIATTAAPFRLTKSASSRLPGVRVIVKAPNGAPVPHIDVALSPDGEPRRTDSDGAAVFEEAKSTSKVAFNIAIYNLEAGPYAVNPEQNEFTFEINGEAITQVNFKSEPLKINGSTLEMRFWDKSKVMLYRKL